MSAKLKLIAIALLVALAQTMAFEDAARGVEYSGYEDIGCITDTECEALYTLECGEDEECAQEGEDQ